MDFDKVNDNGERQEFPTGSKRDTQMGKGRPDLIPIEPLRRLSRHYENGARKYGERNWEKGQPLSRYYASAMRHMWAYMEGDYSEDHLAAAAWNIFSLIATQERIIAGKLPKELDDLGAVQVYNDHLLEKAAQGFDQETNKIPIHDVTLKKNDTFIAKAPEGYILTNHANDAYSIVGDAIDSIKAENLNNIISGQGTSIIADKLNASQIKAGELTIDLKVNTQEATKALQELADVLDHIIKKTEVVSDTYVKLVQNGLYIVPGNDTPEQILQYQKIEAANNSLPKAYDKDRFVGQEVADYLEQSINENADIWQALADYDGPE